MLESLVIINAVFLPAFLALSIIVFIFFKLKLKIWVWSYGDLAYLLGGTFYWLCDQFSPLTNGKTLSNLVVELVGIGVSCSLLFLARSILGWKIPNKSKTLSGFSVLAVIAVVFLFIVLTPSLPE